MSKINVQPKKKLPPNRAPPNRQQPKPANDNVVNRLQELIAEKDSRIDTLTEKITNLTLENKSLKKKVDQLQASSGPPKKKAAATPSAGGGGVDSGPGQAGAANLLAAKLGGHVKTKQAVDSKNGGVESGMSQGDAKNSLAALFGGKPGAAPKKPAGGGVESGPSQAGAAAKLGGLFAKQKSAPPSSPSKSKGGGGADDPAQYAQLFKKYEVMMKLGINVHGAVGKMRTDGVEKHIIAAFEKKHGVGPPGGKTEDPTEFGLVAKKEVPVGKGIKMKRLHWDALPLKTVPGSIWAEMKESDISYDPKHFELHFQVRQRKPEEHKASTDTRAKKGDEPITFVSKKRTQAILIGLKNLNLNNDQLRDILHNMDESVMTVDQLSKLMEMAPTMDEQTDAEKKIMQEGTRRPSDYGTVEQFFFTLCDFYNLQQRLKLWMFKQNFHEITDSLLDQYKTIHKACDKIRSNKNLKLLLTILLTFGNHMNSGTRKGQIFGFDLKILTQLTGVKSFDNTRSLLMYVYEFCDRKYPKALEVVPELATVVKSASSMEIDTLKQAYQRIQENMQEIHNLITSDEIENYDMDDRFIMVMTKFHKEVSPKMKKFNMTVGNVMVSTKRVMKKFSFGTEEEPQTIESFFGIWHKFFNDFQAAKQKLIKLEKERQARIAKRKRQKDLENKKKLHKKFGGNPPKKGLPGQKDDDGVLSEKSSLYQEIQKQQKFEQYKGDLHGKLQGHVKQRSIFIANGGKLDGQPQNDTMRRLSSMYQDQQSQVAAIEEARRKAAIMQYNKGSFRLPKITSDMRQKWSSFSQDPNFEIPDAKPIVAPKGNKRNPKSPSPASPLRDRNISNHGAAMNGHANKQQFGGNPQFQQQNGNGYNPNVPGPPPPQQPMYNNGWQNRGVGVGGNQNFAFQQRAQFNNQAVGSPFGNNPNGRPLPNQQQQKGYYNQNVNKNMYKR